MGRNATGSSSGAVSMLMCCIWGVGLLWAVGTWGCMTSINLEPNIKRHSRWVTKSSLSCEHLRTQCPVGLESHLSNPRHKDRQRGDAMPTPGTPRTSHVRRSYKTNMFDVSARDAPAGTRKLPHTRVLQLYTEWGNGRRRGSPMVVLVVVYLDELLGRRYWISSGGVTRARKDCPR